MPALFTAAVLSAALFAIAIRMLVAKGHATAAGHAQAIERRAKAILLCGLGLATTILLAAVSGSRISDSLVTSDGADNQSASYVQISR
jgi:hypothetical protein